MHKNLKISVVTISYNQKKYLKECIDSVLSQDYKNIEYIVVDPGSTDGSLEVIDSYGSKIIKVYGKDKGPSDGLNNGFFRATGDIFYFINSDDVLMPGVFQLVSKLFTNDPQLMLILGGGEEVDAEGSFVRSYFPSKATPELYVNNAVTFFQQGMFFRKELYLNCGGFNSSNRTSWDGELLLSFLLNGAKYKRVFKKFASFRIYPESITGSQRLKNEFDEDMDRLFRLVYNGKKRFKLPLKIYYRIAKILFDPIYLIKRLHIK